MHELSLVTSIRDIALHHARAARASRILSIRIAIGDLSSYAEEAVGMFWEEISKATEAAGARIEFLRIPGELQCINCSKRFAAPRTAFRCPDCRSDWVKPVAGEECYVDSIEVEAA